MISPRFLPVAVKQVLRRPTRTSLTIAGVAVAMFLFVVVQTMQRGVEASTGATAADTTLVVFRENRFCPATSRLPERYSSTIQRIGGVVSVVPVKIVVSNCGASLDVITYRGVPVEDLPDLSANWTLLEGSLDEWRRRSDAALIGERLAMRRNFKLGDSFESSGVSVVVAGIFRSDAAQDQNVAYVHLPFLQQAAARAGLGEVTQFQVTVADPARLEEVAAAIDDAFRSDAEPTTTRPEKAFVAQAAADIVELVAFTRWLGWACLAAVLALVANAIVLSVQDRVKEHAILQTLGYRANLVARLIIVEGLIVGVAGGVIGALGAALLVHLGNFSLFNEGLTINITTAWDVVALGVLISAILSILAGLVPGWRAGRLEIAQSFRSV